MRPPPLCWLLREEKWKFFQVFTKMFFHWIITRCRRAIYSNQPMVSTSKSKCHTFDKNQSMGKSGADLNFFIQSSGVDQWSAVKCSISFFLWKSLLQISSSFSSSFVSYQCWFISKSAKKIYTISSINCGLCLRASLCWLKTDTPKFQCHRCCNFGFQGISSFFVRLPKCPSMSHCDNMPLCHCATVPFCHCKHVPSCASVTARAR